MSRATSKCVVEVTTEDGSTIKFDEPVSVWQAFAQAEKAKARK
jgi:hypothetical protein